MSCFPGSLLDGSSRQLSDRRKHEETRSTYACEARADKGSYANWTGTARICSLTGLPNHM